MAIAAEATRTDIKEGVTPMGIIATIGNNIPVIAGNNFELSKLDVNQSAIITDTQGNFEFALVEKKENSTRITLWEDIDTLDELATNRNAVIAAITDADKPKVFSLKNKILDSIMDKAEMVFTDLIDLLSGYPELEKEDQNLLLKKINLLSKVYAPEYIISRLQDFSSEDLREFLDTESTLKYFKDLFLSDEEFED